MTLSVLIDCPPPGEFDRTPTHLKQSEGNPSYPACYYHHYYTMIKFFYIDSYPKGSGLIDIAKKC